jgi:protein-tyrosine phosphatase
MGGQPRRVTWLSERRRNGGIDEVRLPVAGGPGRLWLCGKHFIGPDVDAAMARVGATTVVCLNEAHELADRYPQYVAWLRSAPATAAVWHPIPDFHAPSVDVARALVADLTGRLAGGGSLLVHCGAGQGRAGTLAVAILVALGTPLDDAFATVADARSLAGPQSPVQRDLCAALAEAR